MLAVKKRKKLTWQLKLLWRWSKKISIKTFWHVWDASTLASKQLPKTRGFSLLFDAERRRSQLWTLPGSVLWSHPLRTREPTFSRMVGFSWNWDFKAAKYLLGCWDLFQFSANVMLVPDIRESDCFPQQLILHISKKPSHPLWHSRRLEFRWSMKLTWKKKNQR